MNPSSGPGAFGPFRVLHQIGVGVLGPVFRAYDPSRDQPFIVKELRIDVTPEQARLLVESLERLAATGSFNPAVVVPVAAGIEDGTPYFVQEYLAAESLDLAVQRYAAGEVQATLSLLDKLADALDAAHGRGIHHGALHLRDLYVAGDLPRVTGFGIVPALAQVGLRGPLRRPYAAPEVIAGQAWAAAADRFALAAVAYELLTGRRPTGSGAQVGAHVGVPEGDPDSAALQAVFAAGLAALPEQRPASAGRFAAELRAALGEQVKRPAARPAVQAPPNDERQDAGLSPDIVDLDAGEPADMTEGDGEGDHAADMPAVPPPVAPATPVDRPWRWSAARVTLVVLLVAASAAAYSVGLRRGSDITPVAGDAQTGPQPARAADLAPESAAARPAVEPAPVPVPDRAPAAPAPEPIAAPDPAAAAGGPATPPPAVSEPTPPTSDPAPPATAAAPAATEGAGWVLVRTMPPGARVTVGGADRGLTPLSIANVPFGSLEIEVHSDGYASETRQVVLSTAQPIAAVGLELSPLAGADQPDGGGAR